MSNMVGKSVLADKKRIRDLMVQADGGDSNAQYELALCYEHGEGVRKDYAIAADLYGKASRQGDAYAMVNLGMMYEDGRGVTQDFSTAMRLYRLSLIHI